MEFRFDIKPLFKSRITKVGDNLLPEGFKGDRRTILDYTAKIQEILNEMGRESAIAQDLTKSITSGEKLKNSNHTVYFLVDHNSGDKGAVVGFLKVGKKNLYIFDETGANHCKQPVCILDFYIHESQQRRGYGKILYDHMLKEEHVEPHQLAIDRPSVKLLEFLHKHYGLERIIPQSNNFVIFDLFFKDAKDIQNLSKHFNNSVSVSRDSPAGRKSSSSVVNIPHFDNYNGVQVSTGRFAASKRPTTMGNILQSDPPKQTQQNGDTAYAAPRHPSPKVEQALVQEKISVSSANYIESSPPANYVKSSPSSNDVEPQPDVNIMKGTKLHAIEVEQDDDSHASEIQSNCSDFDESQGHLDLKFYHSPLW